MLENSTNNIYQFIKTICPTVKIVYLNVTKKTRTAEIVSSPTYDPGSYFEIQSYVDKTMNKTESVSKEVGQVSSKNAATVLP